MESVVPVVTCLQCGKAFPATMKRSFLGFPKVVCPNCGIRGHRPLTRGFRAFYWVFLGIMLLVLVALFASGGFAIPGILTILVIVALARDAAFRRREARAADFAGLFRSISELGVPGTDTAETKLRFNKAADAVSLTASPRLLDALAKLKDYLNSENADQPPQRLESLLAKLRSVLGKDALFVVRDAEQKP